MVAVLGAGLLGAGAPAEAAVVMHGPGGAWRSPARAGVSSNGLTVLGGGAGGGGQSGVAWAAGRAAATGRAVVASALTTATELTSVAPDGVVTATSYVLPVRVRVRVRRGRGWVPVSTSLRPAGGRLAPAALPGDGVSFSAGGSGPMAVIWRGSGRSRAELLLWWPGRLPVPAVSGASATYRGVLPGVDLVLTATSQAAGGFSEVLVARSAAAVRRAAAVRLRVTGLRLAAAPGGGLTAVFAGGAFTAPAPRMWDSSGPASPAAGRLAAVSSPSAAPGSGSRVARLRAVLSDGGRALSLAPDAGMLAAGAARYPVFLDPDFTVTGREQDYDPVQSGSGCTGSHYNSSSYPYSPVGYDNFQAGSCEYGDTDYALYQVAVPTQGYGPDSGKSLASANVNVLSAQFQVTEVYSSDCSSKPTVNLAWVGAINSGTGWPGPALVKDAGNPASAVIGYDSGSCDTVFDPNYKVSKSFDVLPIIDLKASNMTYRLYYASGNAAAGNEGDHKQFSDNPDLQVTYIDTPDTPSDLNASTGTSERQGQVTCDTTDPHGIPTAAGLPRMGAFSSGGPYLWADFTTGDLNATTDQFRYWIETDAGTTNSTLGSAPNGPGTEDAQVVPAFRGLMTDGVVVGYQAQASVTYSGTTYDSAWSPACYFAAYPSSIASPSITENFSGTPSAGSAVSFTISELMPSTDPISELVWGVDQPPPAPSPPAAQTCTPSSQSCPLTSSASGGNTTWTATVTVTVPSPGPHAFYVFAVDSAAHSSGTVDEEFTGSGDPAYYQTSQSSLGQNFLAALAAGKGFDNQMVSSAAGSPGTANADGSGDAFDIGQLESAGWSPGGTVMVDGAAFTLPQFGSGPDNLLAAGQVLGAGSSGAQGSAVVFLATSTGANALVPGQVTGQPGGVVSADATVPGVPGQGSGVTVPVTGNGCTTLVQGDQTLAAVNCIPATGTVDYAPGCPVTQTAYTLTVPDWVSGPADLAAVYTADTDTPSGQQPDSPKIYAFAVPADPQCTITEVQLPDVGASVAAPAGSSEPLPGLHIFAIAVRDNSAATAEASAAPGSDAALAAAPSGQAWTGAAESPVEGAFAPPSGVTWGDQTFRVEVTPQVTEAAGGQARIRLSYPGFLAGTGVGPLHVTAATIADGTAAGGPGTAAAPVPLAFGASPGSASATIPVGGDVYSDPVPASQLAVTAGTPLLVSFNVSNTALAYLPEGTWASGARTWWAAPGSDHAGDQAGAAFTAGMDASALLAGVDVTTPAESFTGLGLTSPGDPTVVVAGDGVIAQAGGVPFDDAANSPSQRLAGQLYSRGLAPGFGVVDAGIESNQVLSDGAPSGGVSLMARFGRDVLAEPDVGTVVLDEGLADLLINPGAAGNPAAFSAALEADYGALLTQANGFGALVIIGTLTPCYGTAGAACSSAVDTTRTAVNTSIDQVPAPDCVVGLDAAVSGGGSPEVLAAGDAAGTADNFNLSPAGYGQLAQKVWDLASTPGGCPLAPYQLGG